MSAPEAGLVVQVEDVSLRYRVPSERFSTLKEYAIRRLQGRISTRDFWALRRVSLTIEPGEVLGVIGRNGAGKTTLLRLVAGVVRPTAGRVRVRGWPVSPLLEIGAGFHPDLTGRENVHLNATLLGHTKRQIDERLPAIIEFAELADVIDAPLRTYSTGMGMRLGFAVATAWEPRILLVDEVLAVGDESFRRKCERRIDSFRERGASVLLVSHNLAQITSVCSRTVWLDQGLVRATGDPREMVDLYRSTVH